MAKATTAAVPDPWSISVKTVGGGITTEDGNANSAGERLFVVTVSPDDGVATLHDQIEGATGLKASQQRLIYRGRLIGKNEKDAQEEESLEPRIKDIAGLSDGQTIHLMKKRETETQSGSDSDAEAATQTSSTRTSSLESDFGGSSGSGGGSLLAALLGLSSLTDDNNEERDTARQRLGLRSSRSGRSRRPHYRLTAEDLVVPDPGSMEPVRQGLMTLHTLLPHARQTQSESPLEANREWYLGQWLDCRDTVNQWLEATVVEIVNAEDILPPRRTNEGLNRRRLNRRRRLPRVADDPAVGANDLEGRRKLLLEPCETGDLEEEEGELSGFRQRANNQGVQLLLIHYNGWPHRWDEWIRSDSERIRPFRTRTRHPSMNSTASPSPQSVYNEAPSTSIRDGTEAEDRAALLPELSRALTVVNDLLSEVASQSSGIQAEARTNGDLPWLQQANTSNEEVVPDFEGPEEYSNIVEAAESDSFERDPFGPMPTTTEPQYSRRQLQNVATLLDRLGRTLTDAAPHVASLAASLPDESPALVASDVGAAPNDLPETEAGHQPPLGGLLSLWSRDRRRHSLANEESADLRSSVDPDHSDYVSGLVNTTRGEVRSGPRSRAQPDDVAGLLGAYLAAASLGNMSSTDDNDSSDENGTGIGLGRLLRERGNGGGGSGGGGIDIHIHAVVTAPGMAPGLAPGGLGLATLAGGVTTPITPTPAGRNLFSSARDRSRTPSGSTLRSRTISPESSPNNVDDETGGIFEELYSENPTPVDPNGSPQPGESRATPPRQEHSDAQRVLDTNSTTGLSLQSNDGISSTRHDRRGSRQGSERRSSGWRLFRRRGRSNRDGSNTSQS